jgi:hypothetical protein
MTRLRAALADVLRSIAALLRSPQDTATNRQHTVDALARADNFEILSQFEIQMLPRQTRLPNLGGIERLAGAAFIATSAPLARGIDSQSMAPFGDWLDRAAQATADGVALPSEAVKATSAGFETPAVSRLSGAIAEALSTPPEGGMHDKRQPVTL